MNTNIMDVLELKTFYKTRLREFVYAVDRVSFSLKEGEVLGIAGESGCGKSTLALSLMGFYYPPLHFDSGAININKIDIMKLNHDELRVKILGNEIAYIPQSAMNVLNPTQRVINFIEDIIEEHHLGLKKEQIYDLVKTRFQELNLPLRAINAYPIELSGGMKQRVVIAISTILNPKILIADEPTSALDVTTQKIVIKMLKQMMKKGFVKSMIFITHELPILRHICDRIMVMYAGQLIEKGPMGKVVFSPLHPYSKALMDSIIVPEKDLKSWDLACLVGEPPNLKEKLFGCRFADRCGYGKAECREADIEEKRFEERAYRCIFGPEELEELYHRE